MTQKKCEIRKCKKDAVGVVPVNDKLKWVCAEHFAALSK